jgi:hypothetical protein
MMDALILYGKLPYRQDGYEELVCEFNIITTNSEIVVQPYRSLRAVTNSFIAAHCFRS